MSRKFSLIINGAPVPKPVGPRTQASTSSWQRYNAQKHEIRLRARALFRECLTGPIELSAAFYMPLPKSACDNKAIVRKSISGEVLPLGRPDLKNLVAAVEDSLTGVAWDDDSQVVSYGFVFKRYSAFLSGNKSYGHPRTFIMINELADGFRSWPSDKARSSKGPARMHDELMGVALSAGKDKTESQNQVQDEQSIGYPQEGKK